MQPHKYNLVEAAEAVGKNKSTILAAIKSGKISARKNELGGWEIEPAELHRVYPPVAHNRLHTVENELGATAGGLHETDAELVELRVKVEFLERQLGQEREFRQELSRRLDQEAEERRRLTYLLTDQSTKNSTQTTEQALKPPQALQEGRPSLVEKLFGRQVK